jgi:hypothetical protein
MSLHTKLGLHNISSAATDIYGNESWILNQKEIQKLEVA